ncbi:extracellular solute-binding protein [Stappia sp. BW2]|uniref:extracellular solute-binding protein n=1 Tax=Stappia sp. BW2 TaxID=2592622 RepID=UPI0011DE60C6|nr:extracellular solute-binding protein [Stappia sp. BW2]TYC68607.1 extracellular solute-binding protein [Stappia sp. BW2]
MKSGFLKYGALSLAAAIALPVITTAQAEEPITIVINQSPWLPGFQAVVELYEKTSGNTVNLDVNPFAGSLEKQRTAVRAGESPFDLLIMNAGFFTEFYTGGFFKPLKEIDASFELSKGHCQLILVGEHCSPFGRISGVHLSGVVFPYAECICP